jgi:hypothetical protein
MFFPYGAKIAEVYTTHGTHLEIIKMGKSFPNITQVTTSEGTKVSRFFPLVEGMGESVECLFRPVL